MSSSFSVIHVFNNPFIDILKHGLDDDDTLSSLLIDVDTDMNALNELDNNITDFKWRQNPTGSITISFQLHNIGQINIGTGLLGRFFERGMAITACIGNLGNLQFFMEGINDNTHIWNVQRCELATDAIRLLLDMSSNRQTFNKNGNGAAVYALLDNELNLNVDQLLEGNYRLFEQTEGYGMR